MLCDAKMYTSFIRACIYSRECGLYNHYNLNKEINNHYLLFYSFNKACNFLQQVLDSDNSILDHVDLIYQTSSVRFLSKKYMLIKKKNNMYTTALLNDQF